MSWSIAPTVEQSGGGLALARAEINLPPLLPASVATGQEAVAALEEERERHRAAGNEGGVWWAEPRLARTRQGLAFLLGGPAVPPVPAELVALRLGREVALVTAPGEIFTEIGQAIVAHSPFLHTF